MTRPSAVQSLLRRPDLGMVESTDGRWETASARPRVGEKHIALSLLRRTKGSPQCRLDPLAWFDAAAASLRNGCGVIR